MKLKYVTFSLVFLISLGFTGCSEDSIDTGGDGSNGSGKGGSMARFAVTGNHLYTVDNTSLKTFDITDPQDPTPENNEVSIGRGMETIFPYKNKLFLGSQFGMHVYDISTPSEPGKISYFEHITACDPVVANDNYAYVTLSSERWCGRSVNELQIININDIHDPKLVKQRPMNKPKGLGLDGDTLFVCDNGLKVFKVTNGVNIDRIKHFEDIEAYDVIPNEGNLIVTGSDGIRQYTYSNEKIDLLSELTVEDE